MPPRLPPMQALRAFEAAARTQSLTKAAQSLNLTHGAISHQIKGLEADLGIRLIERAGRAHRVCRAHRRCHRAHDAFEPATDARERGAVVRRALAAAADRTLRRR